MRFFKSQNYRLLKSKQKQITKGANFYIQENDIELRYPF